MDFEEKEVEDKINKLIEEKGYELIGINAEAIARVLKKAIKK